MSYKIYELLEIHNKFIKKINNEEVFIGCISYEERSLAIINYFDDEIKYKIGLFFINDSVKEIKSVEEKKKSIQNELKKFFDKVQIIYISQEYDYHQTGLFIHETLKKYLLKNEINTITIDITTFKRYQLVYLIYFLSELKKNIRFFYISPLKYGEWQSEHFKEAQTLPLLYNEEFDLRKEKLLIIILGFEMERALKLIDDLKPHKVIFGRTYPPTSEKHKIIQDKKLIDGLNPFVNNFSNKIFINFHGYDLELIENELNNILINNKKKYNIFISIIGPKVQLLALVILYCKNKDFNFFYNSALNYNYKNYSEGIERLFEYRTDTSFRLIEF